MSAIKFTWPFGGQLFFLQYFKMQWWDTQVLYNHISFLTQPWNYYCQILFKMILPQFSLLIKKGKGVTSGFHCSLQWIFLSHHCHLVMKGQGITGTTCLRHINHEGRWGRWNLTRQKRSLGFTWFEWVKRETQLRLVAAQDFVHPSWAVHIIISTLLSSFSPRSSLAVFKPVIHSCN